MPPSEAEARSRSSFAVKVDFVRGAGNPTRPFTAMASLIEALVRFDRDLAARVVKNMNEMILKVKKPDFIGASMWEFV